MHELQQQADRHRIERRERGRMVITTCDHCGASNFKTADHCRLCGRALEVSR